jgi:protein TonB
MFDDSLVESAGRIRTRSKWFAIASFLLQAALVAALILIPLLYPAALPKQALTAMLVAPPPATLTASSAGPCLDGTRGNTDPAYRCDRTRHNPAACRGN